MRISLQLADLTLEQVALALNFNTVSTVAAGAGTPGYKKIGLARGSVVVSKALLVRGGLSPYGDTWAMQFEVPVVVEVGEPEIVWVKGEPALVALEFMAIEDPDASTPAERFGRLIAQNATAV
jgi:hypothetical protein